MQNINRKNELKINILVNHNSSSDVYNTENRFSGITAEKDSKNIPSKGKVNIRKTHVKNTNYQF